MGIFSLPFCDWCPLWVYSLASETSYTQITAYELEAQQAVCHTPAAAGLALPAAAAAAASSAPPAPTPASG
eukprot:4566877-Pyramimonas_sp.AAC.1